MKYALILFLFLLFSPAYAQEAAVPPDTVTAPAGSPPPMRSYMGATKPRTTDHYAPKQRQPNVEIWLPPEFQSTEQKWPLLIFSHGFGGCAKQSKFLTQYLADHGYIVIAPDHEDARCNRGVGGGGFLQSMRPGTKDWPEKPFRNPEAWDDKTESDRREDVLFALSSMLDDRQYKNYVDTDRMGLIGHSLGGYTVLGLSGAWPSWRDKRFKAVLALSPYIDPFIASHTIGKVGVPVMYQGGTKDIDITPSIRKKGYPAAHTPKYFVEYNGAGHFAWTELDRDYQTIIEKTALQFFDKYVKGEKVDILPEGADKPGRPVNKVKTFWKDEGEGLKN